MKDQKRMEEEQLTTTHDPGPAAGGLTPDEQERVKRYRWYVDGLDDRIEDWLIPNREVGGPHEHRYVEQLGDIVLRWAAAFDFLTHGLSRRTMSDEMRIFIGEQFRAYEHYRFGAAWQVASYHGLPHMPPGQPFGDEQ